MAKRRRADRRRGQIARAIASGDAYGLSSLRECSPETAAAGLLQAAERHRDASFPIELVELIAETSERLRIAGKCPAALRLAAAGRRATPAIRFEEAVAALACGRDDVARELAALDPSVARALASAMAVLSGVDPPRATSTSPTARAIHAVCRAVRAMQTGKAAMVRAQLAAVPADLKARLCVSELRDASRVTPGKVSSAISAARVLLGSPVVRGRPEVQRALARDLAAIVPRGFLDGTARSWGFTPEALAEGVTTAIGHDASIQGTEARVVQLVLRAGIDLFPPEHRGTAALFLGFALSTSDPHGAQLSFDRAVALGADLVESLRGRWLLTAATVHEGTVDPDMERLRAQGRDAGERLSHLLERVPDGVPFAVAIAHERARWNVGLRQYPVALEVAQKARAMMEAAGIRSPIVSADLLCVEAVCRSREEPLRALELARAGRKLNPSDARAWELEVALARRCERHVEAEDTILEAADRGVPGAFAAEATQIRRQRGLPVLFPGRTSAGFLTVELATRLRAVAPAATSGRILEILGAADLAAVRAALPRQQQVAYDAATIVLLGRLVSADRAAHQLQTLLRDVELGSSEAAWLLAATARSVESKAIPALGRAIERAGLAPGAMVILAELVAESHPLKLSGAFLAAVASRLGHTQIAAVGRRLARTKGSSETVADALREIDRWLAPEISLGELVDGALDIQNLGDGMPLGPPSAAELRGGAAADAMELDSRSSPAFRAHMAEQSREFLREMQIGPDVIARLGEDALIDFATKMDELWGDGAAPDLFGLIDAINRLGISPADIMLAAGRGRGGGGRRRRRR